MDARPTQTRWAFILQMGGLGFIAIHFVFVGAAGILYLTGTDWRDPLIMTASQQPLWLLS
jgi:hypothetical protein